MFKFKRNKNREFNKKATIVSDFEVLIEYNGEVILAIGKNVLDEDVLYASITEDEIKRMSYYFSIIPHEKDLEKFLNKEISCRKLMESKDTSIFILEVSFDYNAHSAYPIKFSDIPKDYLPTTDSFLGVEE